MFKTYNNKNRQAFISRLKNKKKIKNKKIKQKQKQKKNPNSILIGKILDKNEAETARRLKKNTPSF